MLRATIRRRLLLAILCIGLGGGSVHSAERSPLDAVRPSAVIVAENEKPGATDWQLTRVRLDKIDGFRSPWIEGYCSRQSVKPGESIDICVSTNPPQQFAIEVFRMGYYGGRGARLMTRLGPFAGKTQPTPPVGLKTVTM